MATIRFNSEFPGYEILGEIGRSNARVLKARNQRTGELVAIKHFALNTDADTLRRFQREAQIMTDIHNPNVVRVQKVCLEAAMPYIVMEWVEGGDLRGLLKERGQLDILTTIRLGFQMAKAFNAIHPKGIIHRDVKPENILYRLLPSGEFHFLLTDFGIASARIASEQNDEHRTKTGHSLLTYEYASPEQFDNPKEVGISSDYYSLGVVLYECLSGRVPFSLRGDVGISTFMIQVINSVPSPIQLASSDHLPNSLNQLLFSMLAKNPTDRLNNLDRFELLLSQTNTELFKTKLDLHILPESPSPSGTNLVPDELLIVPLQVNPKAEYEASAHSESQTTSHKATIRKSAPTASPNPHIVQHSQSTPSVQPTLDPTPLGGTSDKEPLSVGIIILVTGAIVSLILWGLMNYYGQKIEVTNTLSGNYSADTSSAVAEESIPGESPSESQSNKSPEHQASTNGGPINEKIDANKNTARQNDEQDNVFTVVEQQPEFPGGMAALGQFLQQNLRYPEPAQRANVEGRVFVSFVVNTDGSVQEVRVLKGLGFGTDEEAQRVVRIMPKWHPGKHLGRFVRVKFNLPVNFTLE